MNNKMTRLISHSEFLSKRFDIVIRFHFLKETWFNVDDATALYTSIEYKFLEEILERSKLFESKNKHTWNYVDEQIKKDRHWLRGVPYVLTTMGVGLAVKRFLMAIKYGAPLFWFVTDYCPEKANPENKKFYNEKWLKRTYIENLMKKHMDRFEKAQECLEHLMNWYSFFSEKTLIGRLKNETIELYDSSFR